MQHSYDVIVIGGGQSGLAVGYYLRRSGLSFIILDKEESPGGSWQHYWKSLRLFSPAQWSSLPGTLMPGGTDYYPNRDEVISYLSAYEHKYELPVKRPVQVLHVKKITSFFELFTTERSYFSKAVISTTGSFSNPFIPYIKSREKFKGRVLHSSQYQSADEFYNHKVAVVGEGNSGAQILAEVSEVAETIWITGKQPVFHPPHINGRHLFDAATKMYEAQQKGIDYQPLSLSNIVMVDAVQKASKRGVYKKVLPPFHSFCYDGLLWENGYKETADTVIFATGFMPSLEHLFPLNNSIDTNTTAIETKLTHIEGLWLTGYGNWTGFASATLIGIGRNAKRTVDEVKIYVTNKSIK